MRLVRIALPLCAALLAGPACRRATAPDVPAPAPAGRAQVVFTFYPPSAHRLGPEAVSVTWDDGRGPRRLSGADFSTRDYGVPHTETFATRAAGELRVRAALVRGDTLGTGEVTLPLRDDWVWGVSVHADTTHPLRGCFGCMGARGFPLRAGAGLPVDSFYLVWGGNSISRPAVY